MQFGSLPAGQRSIYLSLSVVGHSRHAAVSVVVKVPGVSPCTTREATRARLCFMGARRSERCSVLTVWMLQKTVSTSVGEHVDVTYAGKGSRLWNCEVSEEKNPTYDTATHSDMMWFR